MRQAIRVFGIAILALGTLAADARSQQTETPVAFDSAGKVRSLTPALVTRFQLALPAWPVSGDFVEARMFVVSTGGRVLAVERRSGSLERYSLSDEDARRLGSLVDAGLTRSGAAAMEARPELLSQPARGAFVRNQMILTWLVYGPLLSSLADDGKAGTALYLLATGASYFITTGVSRDISVTRAQNHLASDGALRGAGAAWGLLYAVGGEEIGQKTVSGVGLIGALGGAIAGFNYGKALTDSEAEATSTISTFSAATALGLAGATGLLSNGDNARGALAATITAGTAGYFLGAKYPRTSRFTVTRGDVQMLSIGGILGAATALTPIVDAEIDERLGFGVVTAGMLGGLLLADRVMVKGFNYTSSEASQVWLGTVAGGLIGSALAVLVEPEAVGTMALVTGGAVGGTLAGHSLANPARARPRTSALPAVQRSLGAARLQIDPAGAVLGMARVPGRHALLSLTF